MRDSTSYRGSFGLAMKVPGSPSGTQTGTGARSGRRGWLRGLNQNKPSSTVLKQAQKVQDMFGGWEMQQDLCLPISSLRQHQLRAPWGPWGGQGRSGRAHTGADALLDVT